jgi:hypothetical protein
MILFVLIPHTLFPLFSSDDAFGESSRESRLFVAVLEEDKGFPSFTPLTFLGAV